MGAIVDVAAIIGGQKDGAEAGVEVAEGKVVAPPSRRELVDCRPGYAGHDGQTKLGTHCRTQYLRVPCVTASCLVRWRWLLRGVGV